MLLPKSRGGWQATRASLRPTRAISKLLTRARVLVIIALVGTVLLLWRGIRSSAPDMHKFDFPSLLRLLGVAARISLTWLFRSFYCWGPSKSPMEMTANEHQSWTSHLKTPVIFNSHAPLEVNSSTIQRVDLNPIKSTIKALKNEERVLILTPLKDASRFLSKYFELVSKLTYPHHLIDLAFLVSDTTDDTIAVLAAELDRIQKGPDGLPFRSATVVEKDFGFMLSQDVKDRHGYAAQAPRRKALARARNYLLYTALKPDHSWVYWRDADIVENPETIIEDFIAHDRDVLVPSMDSPQGLRLVQELTPRRHLVSPI
jgi:hypothetical protein